MSDVLTNSPYLDRELRSEDEVKAARRLCIDCAHYMPGDQHADADKRAEFSRCRTIVDTTNEGLTRVDGRPLVIKYKYCETARMVGGKCGEAGKLFEAAPKVVTP